MICDDERYDSFIVTDDVVRHRPGPRKRDDDGLLSLDAILAEARRFKRIPAIYFLIRDEKVVYIGKAEHAPVRIATHRYDKTKQFNKVFVLPCKSENLDFLERRYIFKFKPIYNIAGNRGAEKIP